MVGRLGAFGRADRRRSARLLGVAIGLAALCAPVGGAWAQSGDGPLNPDNPTEVPTYSIPEATCNTIRQAVDNDFDLVLACSIAGRSSNPNNTPCDLIDGNLNAGTPIGQCSDSFPIPLTVPEPDSDTLEAGVTLSASAGGLNLALGDRDRISVTSAGIADDGKVGSLLGLVDVRACPSGGPCPEGDAVCSGIPVVRSATACSEVTGQLVTSVLEVPPELSHALFLDVEQTATNAFLSVAVCPNYTWSCGSATADLPGTSYEGQVPFSVAFTPLCTRTARLTLCCATNAAGQVIKPCPK